MIRKSSSLLTDLSTGDLKRLLAARERIDVLEGEQQRLLAELGKVEKELAQLLAGDGLISSRKAKANTRGRKRKSTLGTKGKARGNKGTSRKASGRVKLEDVIAEVLVKNGQAMNFKELYGTIVDGKLFKSKSKNFDNVLRRTLSTSKLVKRVARGVYEAA